MLKTRNTIEDAVNYLYNIDFTAAKDMIVELKAGDVLPPIFASILKGIHGDLWKVTSASEYSIFDAKVIYNGKNSLDYRTCGWFPNILVVDISSGCSAIQGNLVFHYH